MAETASTGFAGVFTSKQVQLLHSCLDKAILYIEADQQVRLSSPQFSLNHLPGLSSMLLLRSEQDLLEYLCCKVFLSETAVEV